MDAITAFKHEVYGHYLDEDLQVTIDRDPGKWTTGNGLLYSGIFYTILGINNALTSYDVDCFLDAVNRCWVTKDDEYVYGLLNRDKGRIDLEAHDDYIGVCAASYFCGTDTAKRILEYGQKNHYSYDNTAPNHFSFNTWQARFPGLIGFYCLAAKEPPGNIQTIEMLFEFDSDLSSSHSGNILTWLMAQVARRQSSRFDEQIKCWMHKFNEKYFSFGNCFLAYLQKEESDHPFCQIDNVEGHI